MPVALRGRGFATWVRIWAGFLFRYRAAWLTHRLLMRGQRRLSTCGTKNWGALCKFGKTTGGERD